MKTLVTGATGLVGSHLVEYLLERGDSVRALVRDERRAEPLARLGAELIPGDLSKPASLKPATRGIDVVYHCAARVSLPFQGNREVLLKTNVEGTKNLLESSVQSGVRRFVFVSSVAVYGDARCELVGEDHPLLANGPYGESKIRAEQLIRECEKCGSLETVILRPCVIYGPRDTNFLPQISQALPGRRFPLVNGGYQLLDMVYVTDVAEALLLTGTKVEAVGQTYNVTDGGRHSIRKLVELFGKTLDRPPRTWSVPYPIAYSFAALSYRWSKLRRSGEEPLISPGGVRAMARPHHYDISKIQKELGYTPRVPLEEGLKRAVDWYLNLK
ncbi:MAG: hypothetical protein A2Z21_02110 [Candidatus Fraserbacteria bacterium RBG_16_55_9]|uniref:NAD-dependent epimerase/dehydratase domain-containing protein n=1 Tax=Fraserbacteria sp. (strain RBG_16_55_9) TaxID=1817864 RepID=A0A1F5V1C0_FRAXR|nr:MAG: hypothetical protein A2Z21_02110 [Candidatus Fraserbacteria bacterium RBG_16_55_9]